MAETVIVSLPLLKPRRLSLGLKLTHLHDLTTIPVARLGVLETLSANTAQEPWLDEAVALARALGAPSVITCLKGGELRDHDYGFDPRDDLAVWRTGCRLPLSTACRIAILFGLNDPIELELPTALHRELWTILASSERAPALGTCCPWCAMPAQLGHLDTCLPNNLWGARDADVAGTIGQAPTPAKPGRGRGGSSTAHGLKAYREGRGTTQAAFAASVTMDANHYARIERGDLPLTIKLASRIAAIYGVDMAQLYAPPSADETTVSGEPEA